MISMKKIGIVKSKPSRRIFAKKTNNNSDPKSPSETRPKGQKTISRYCPFKPVAYRCIAGLMYRHLYSLQLIKPYVGLIGNIS